MFLLQRLCVVLAVVASSTGFAQGVTSIGRDAVMPVAAWSGPEGAADIRQIVRLTGAEKALVLDNMRQMLASVERVTDGLARGDKDAVARAASSSGMVMMKSLPSATRKKFPPAFTQLSSASHKAFDQIASEIQTDQDPKPVLKLLSQGLQACVACHSAYRFESSP